ncbi:hypothetical protein BpHYR1_041845 [Brachionus plicatilis]|uniref:Uncharacterized protein n=1 Tax=Brachionus plicatilis TaxID=10195 RepID=A0A3M7QC68_BRAPC|nr:hypothetical protein BpHYR1_041845 [Brachionus plicatilis]
MTLAPGEASDEAKLAAKKGLSKHPNPKACSVLLISFSDHKKIFLLFLGSLITDHILDMRPMITFFCEHLITKLT